MNRFALLLPLSLAAVSAVLAADPLPQGPIHTPYAQQAPLALRTVTLSAKSVPVYGKVELDVDATGTWDNPFEPQDVALDASFRAPSGHVDTVPGFYYRPYRRSRGEKGEEVLTPAGPGSWKVRYSPSEPGAHTISLRFRDRTGNAGANGFRFTAVKSASPGYVRVSEHDHHYFEFENGRPYFPLGANLCWAGARGTFDYDDWTADYARAGCNYGRLWLSPQWTTFALERSGKSENGQGIGQFDLGNAWRLDHVLDLAGARGLYLALCVDSYNVLRARTGYPEWERSPQNAANGGPLQRPEEFWTDPVMERYYRNKLRYLVARYGYSTHLLSWELWNEVDGTTGYQTVPVREWHRKMAEALKNLDTYGHPVTTSFARTEGDRAIDTLPELDYVQTHHYGSPDLAATVARAERTKHAYGKPHFVGEVGADSGGARKELDPTGLQIHDPLWVSVASGVSGAAAPWWWDSYIAPARLYGQFAGVARFVKGIEWPEERMRPISPRVEWTHQPRALPRTDAALEGGPVTWDDSPYNRPRTIQVIRTGLRRALPVAGIQHGTRNHPAQHNPITFQTDLPWPCRFEVEVSDVSGFGGAALTVRRDGIVALVKEFVDNQPGSETRHQFAGKYAIDVPAGKHRIVVENTGADWFLAGYRFRQAVEAGGPSVLAWASAGKRTAVAWARLEGRTWRRVCQLHETIPPAPPTTLVLPGLLPGRWEAEIWDTTAGKVLRRTDLTVSRTGTAKLPVGPIVTDVAVRMTREFRETEREHHGADHRPGPRRPERKRDRDDDD